MHDVETKLRVARQHVFKLKRAGEPRAVFWKRSIGTAVRPLPEVHADRIREAEQLGASTLMIMNCSGADPHKAIEVYGGKVLPALAKATSR